MANGYEEEPALAQISAERESDVECLYKATGP